MPQPIFVVDRAKVLHWIQHQAEFNRCPSSAWGRVNHPRELIDAINSLKRHPDDTIDMPRVAQCLQEFYTCKMPAQANRVLIRLWALIKMERKVLTLSPVSV